MLSKELEISLNDAFKDARDKHHEFMTVEHLLLALTDNAAVGVGDVLSARRGRLLVGSPRGRAVELSVVTCRGDEPRSASR